MTGYYASIRATEDVAQYYEAACDVAEAERAEQRALKVERIATQVEEKITNGFKIHHTDYLKIVRMLREASACAQYWESEKLLQRAEKFLKGAVSETEKVLGHKMHWAHI